MNKENILLKKIENIVEAIDEIIYFSSESVESFSSINQLRLFKKTFISVRHEIQANNVPPKGERCLGVANIIIDQWPFDFYLSEWLVEAEQMYKNL